MLGSVFRLKGEQFLVSYPRIANNVVRTRRRTTFIAKLCVRTTHAVLWTQQVTNNEIVLTVDGAALSIAVQIIGFQMSSGQKQTVTI